MDHDHLNRRTLAKGAAWSLPVIATTAVAPAFAASPAATLNNSGMGTWNLTWTGSGTDGYQSFKFYSVTPGTNRSGQGFCVGNTRTTSKISNAKITFYVPYSRSLTFYPGGYGTNGWSTPTYDASKPTKSYGGVTYYPYSTTYSGTITAKSGTTCFPVYSFESQDYVRTTGYFYVDNSVTVDGKVLTQSFGPVTMYT